MLSILICSLYSRSRQLGELMAVLDPQRASNGDVEVIVDLDGGESSIGTKRNRLVSKASKKYCCFIDDDDTVDPDYVALILEAIKAWGPDCVGICGYLVEDGKIGWQFRHSITVGRWCKDKVKKIYFRTPNHLNPIKTEIVRLSPFPEINFGEDRAFSDSVRKHLRTEGFIGRPIYFYQQKNK